MDLNQLLELLLSLQVIRIISALIVILVAYLLISKIIIPKLMKLSLRAPPEVVLNLTRLIKLLTITIAVFIALGILGIDLGGILIAAGFTSLVIGLALQQTLSQLFAGISLLIEGRIKVGESISIGDTGGVVEHIGIMTTQIRRFTGEVLTIPNNTMASSNIINISRSIARRIDITVGVSYGSRLDKAIDIIMNLLESHELVLADPPPRVLIEKFGESSIDLTVRFWVPSQYFIELKSTILGEIKKRFDEAGIEIPFPQRVLWIRSTHTNP